MPVTAPVTAEDLREDLRLLVARRRDARDVELLSVGSERVGECHWRLRTSSGQVVVLRIMRLREDEE